MKTVFIQYEKQNSSFIPVSINAHIAEYGFKKMGYEINHFSKDEIAGDFRMLKSCIFVGGTNTLLKIIDVMGAPKPKTFNPHVYLPNYCNREIKQITLEDAKHFLRNNVEFFIKPAEDTKMFDGFVCRSEVDLIKTAKIPNETQVLISEIIKIKAEYRCFVHKKQLIDVRHYAGDFMDKDHILQPNLHVIKNAIEDFKEQPIAYTLDFALLENGSTELIEINDGFSLGNCGLHPTPYCQMLEDRWIEIIRS